MMEQSITTCPEPLQRKSLDIFICMLVISMILHVVISVFVLVPGRTMVQGRQPLYVDLGTMPAVSHPAKSVVAEEYEPAEEPEAPPVENPAEPLSQAETLDKSVSETLRDAAGRPEVVHRSSIGLGITSGYFGSFAEGETLRPEIREYYFNLMRRINEVWWTRSASTPSLNGASFILVVNREGKVVACQPLQGSGDPRNDQVLMETVKLAEPLPPLPDGYPDRDFNAPIRFIPPLNLMLPGFMRKQTAPHG